MYIFAHLITGTNWHATKKALFASPKKYIFWCWIILQFLSSLSVEISVRSSNRLPTPPSAEIGYEKLDFGENFYQKTHILGGFGKRLCVRSTPSPPKRFALGEGQLLRIQWPAQIPQLGCGREGQKALCTLQKWDNLHLSWSYSAHKFFYLGSSTLVRRLAMIMRRRK